MLVSFKIDVFLGNNGKGKSEKPNKYLHIDRKPKMLKYQLLYQSVIK